MRDCADIGQLYPSSFSPSCGDAGKINSSCRQSGRQSVNSLPWPSADLTLTSPPCKWAKLWVSAKPKPVPGKFRFKPLSNWRNGSNNKGSWSEAIPIPVSLTVKQMPSVCFVTINETSPAGVNLTALESRLSNICLQRRSSATTIRARGSMCNESCNPCS